MQGMVAGKRKKKEIPLANQGYALKQGLTEKEWIAITNGLGRVPNELECETFTVLWADKNSHKNSNLALANLKELTKKLLSEQRQDYNEVTCFCSTNEGQLEVEPFTAAGVCLGKVLDQLTLTDARGLGVIGIFILGGEESNQTQQILKRGLEGLSWYANCVGLPILNTEVYFDPTANNMPLINVGIVAEVSSKGKNQPSLDDKSIELGSKIYHLGSKVRMSSLDVYDPLLQNKLNLALSGAIEKKLISYFQIVGESEFAFAVTKLAYSMQKGVIIQLEKIPHITEAAKPEELLFNRTPQQIIFIPARGKQREVSDYFSFLNLNLSNIGEVVALEDTAFDWHNYQIVSIPYRLGIEGVINSEINISRSSPMLKHKPALEGISVGEKNLAQSYIGDKWVDLLANPNLSSKRLIYGHFDWLLESFNGIAPETRAQVLKTTSNSQHNGAITVSCNRRACSVDSYLGALQSSVECLRALAEIGAKAVSLSLGLNFGDLDNLNQRSQFTESIRGLEDLSRIWRVPVVNQSFSFNRMAGQVSYPPSPVVFMVGVLENCKSSCSYYFKSPGDCLLLIGLTSAELSCSDFESYCLHKSSQYVPEIDLVKEQRIANFIVLLIEKGLLQSSFGIARGGLALALTKCGLGMEKPLGASLKLAQTIIEEQASPEAYLFSESEPRFLVSCRKSEEQQVRELAKEHGVVISGNGKIGGNTISISGAVTCEVSLSTLNRVWLNGLNHIFERTEEVYHAAL